MLTREEFLREEGPFSFCLDPLDVNVAKMHKWIDREVRLWQEGQAYSTTEYWVARNPERELSKVSITVQQTTACCTITVRVTDKPLRYIAERTVWTGTLDELKRLMVGDNFLIVCKRELLWWDYALEHHKDDSDLLAAGWQRSGDVLPDFMDYVKEQLSRLLTEWDEVVPEHGTSSPVFDIFANPDDSSQDEVGAYGLKIFKMPADIVADEDKVAVKWDLTGTHDGDFMGIKPTNKKISVCVMNFYYFNAQGKITNDIAAEGMIGILRGIGVI